jgi:hypothetical protein
MKNQERLIAKACLHQCEALMNLLDCLEPIRRERFITLFKEVMNGPESERGNNFHCIKLEFGV